MIGEIEAIESDDLVEVGVNRQKEDMDCKRRKECTLEAREKSSFILKLNLNIDQRRARF